MQSKLGKNGVMLWRYTNGLDESRVAHEDYTAPAKSVGHGITCTADLTTHEEAKKVIVALSQDIGYKLRLMHLRAKAIHLYVRDNDLNWKGWQTQAVFPTQDEKTVSCEAYRLLESKYNWKNPIRSLTVSAIQLENVDAPTQLGMFYDNAEHERRERLTQTVDHIRDSYGKEAIVPAIILDESKTPKGKGCDEILPGWMYQ